MRAYLIECKRCGFQYIKPFRPFATISPFCDDCRPMAYRERKARERRMQRMTEQKKVERIERDIKKVIDAGYQPFRTEQEWVTHWQQNPDMFLAMLYDLAGEPHKCGAVMRNHRRLVREHAAA